MSNTTRAYCYADGVIRFQDATAKLPAGALPIAVAPRRVLETTLSAVARHAYDNKTLLVPVVPEAEDQQQGCDALLAFTRMVKQRLDDKAKSGDHPELTEAMRQAEASEAPSPTSAS